MNKIDNKKLFLTIQYMKNMTRIEESISIGKKTEFFSVLNKKDFPTIIVT